MRKSRLTVILALTLALLLAFGVSTAMAKKIRWKIQQAYSSNLPELGTGLVWMVKELKEASDGQINLKIYEPGKLVKAFEVLEAVSKGQVDGGCAGAGFWAGKLPAAPLFSSVPFGPEAPEYLAWYYYGNGWKLSQEMYDKAGYKVRVIPCVILPPETAGWFLKPIKSLDDLKGMKMRFYGYGGEAMQKLGMNITLMPPSELFPALEKKVIDATEFSLPTIDQRLGFYKIAKFNYFPGWHQQATVIDLYINKGRWDKITKAQRKMIEMAAMASMTNSLASGESTQGPIIKENTEKRGVKNMYWDAKFLAAFKAKWLEVAKEMAAKDPMFKKAYDDLEAFRAKYAYWSNLGFLPRNCKK